MAAVLAKAGFEADVVDEFGGDATEVEAAAPPAASGATATVLGTPDFDAAAVGVDALADVLASGPGAALAEAAFGGVVDAAAGALVVALGSAVGVAFDVAEGAGAGLR